MNLKEENMTLQRKTLSSTSDAEAGRHSKRTDKVRVSILGVNGYTGYELIRILLRHPNIQLTHLSQRQDPPPLISDLHPALRGLCDGVCSLLDMKQIAGDSDLVFSALPHTVSMQLIPELLDHDPSLYIIDLSADYRLHDPRTYKNAYQTEHVDPDRLGDFVYGLPEFNRETIRHARLIANPGCFPTGIQLSLLPLLRAGCIDPDSVIIDSKTGVSGGGRQPKDPFHFPQINENMHAYRPGEHQHEAEIEQQLKDMAGRDVDVVFVPHLIPVTRGILNTVYCRLKPCEKLSGVEDTGTAQLEEELRTLFSQYYTDHPFVRILPAGKTPQINHVNYSNFCDIGLKSVGDRLILMSAVDNLIKGASGQAVQNMNLMLGFPETEALL